MGQVAGSRIHDSLSMLSRSLRAVSEAPREESWIILGFGGAFDTAT
jgi:hypothetical protein